VAAHAWSRRPRAAERLRVIEMDEHFSWPVYEPVDEVNRYFRDRLFSVLAGTG